MIESADAIARAQIFSRIRCVLVRPSHPGNIGAAARAIRTMGLHHLALVAPHAFPHGTATAMAVGAGDVLAAAKVSANLEQAIGDCHLVLGATARRRDIALDELAPRAAAQRVLAAASAGQQVALLFGNEQSGLDNDELHRCHAAISIPSDPDFSSLNLAQAVQVIAYEIRMAWLVSPPAAPSRAEPPANAADMEAFFAHLARTLEDIGFYKGHSPRTTMYRLRRFFLGAAPDARELRILHGILTDASRMAKLAREKPE